MLFVYVGGLNSLSDSFQNRRMCNRSCRHVELLQGLVMRLRTNVLPWLLRSAAMGSVFKSGTMFLDAPVVMSVPRPEE